MAATATPRLDMCQTPQQTAEVNALDFLYWEPRERKRSNGRKKTDKNTTRHDDQSVLPFDDEKAQGPMKSVEKTNVNVKLHHLLSVSQ